MVGWFAALGLVVRQGIVVDCVWQIKAAHLIVAKKDR